MVGGASDAEECKGNTVLEEEPEGGGVAALHIVLCRTGLHDVAAAAPASWYTRYSISLIRLHLDWDCADLGVRAERDPYRAFV